MSAMEITKRLRANRFTTMALQLERRLEREAMPEAVESWLSQMLEAKETACLIARQERAHQRAGMPLSADLSGIDYIRASNFTAADIAKLAPCAWLDDGRRMFITGKAGTGKTWLACAFGTQAIGLGKKVRYADTLDLLEEWTQADVDKRLRVWREELAACQLLILDNFLTCKLSRRHAEILLRILMDRQKPNGLIVVSPLPIHHFHQRIADPVLADQIADRFLSAIPLVLQGDSWRKPKASCKASPAKVKAASRNATRVPKI